MPAVDWFCSVCGYKHDALERCPRASERDEPRQNTSIQCGENVGDLIKAMVELRRVLRHLDIDPNNVAIRMSERDRVRLARRFEEMLRAPWDPPKIDATGPLQSLLGFQFYS